MNTSVETIGPALAARYLEKNYRNRPIQKNHIRDICNEMINGRWKENGEPIIFSHHGLEDGQHRLHAVVKTGLSFRFLVVTGVDQSVFSTIDCGKPRRGSDALSIAGHKNSRQLESVLRIIERYDREGFQSGGEARLSPQYILELSEKYQGVRLSDSNHYRMLKCRSLASAAEYIFSRIDKEAAEIFLTKVFSGENLSVSDPEFLLRNRLISNASSQAKLPTHVVFALMIKAWNARRSGLSLKVLKFLNDGPNKEEFPKAI